MKWSSGVKKVTNIFNAIVSVGQGVGSVVSELGMLRAEATKLAENVKFVSASLDTFGSTFTDAMNNFTGTFETYEQIGGLVDQFGVQQSVPHKAIDVIAHLGQQLGISHEKIDALVDRLGHQYQNEVLAVLQKENAELEALVRELRGLLTVAEASKDEKNGNSEGDQVESVPQS